MQWSWWQHGIIYQVYPRSFADSNGDGIGDLLGITGKLDYLAWLGISTIWLSPIYPSPMVDFGYDVTNYTDIDPIYGTLADFDCLVASAHAHGLKVILDFVPNHTSDQHPWFIESRSSRANPKRDWYIWRDPKPDGGPPTNWLSTFGGSAWAWDPSTGQYYYHAYLRQQPDLNWRNSQVQDAMLNIMRFWLDRGVDGFRVDVIWHLIKDEHFRDNPANPDYRPGQWPYHQLLATYTTDRPEVHDIISKMRRLIDAYDNRLLIGEVYLPIQRLVTYYGASGAGAHLPFNFQLIEVPWDAATIANTITAYEAALPADAWPNWVLGNHDKRRLASRIGRGQARVAAMLLLTLRGTPTLYYGDELGMHDVPIRPDAVRDPWERNMPGYGVGRDPARTPMPWTGEPGGGFTEGTPWLPIGDEFVHVNVRSEQADPASCLMLYRKLIALRQGSRALLHGRYEDIRADGALLCYARVWGDERLFIALNLSDEPRTFSHPSVRGKILQSTWLDRLAEAIEGETCLRANEGLIIQVS